MAMNSFLPLLGMAVLLVGCDSKSKSSTETPSDPSTTSRSEGAPLSPGTESATATGAKERMAPANPAAETGVALSVPQTAAPRSPQEVTMALDELTQALRKYSAEKQRVPKNLTEVAAAGYLKGIPKAPTGKKFAIKPDRVEVILVNQ